MSDPHEPIPDQPILCTMRPGDDEHDHLERYRALFADAYLRGERTASGLRWTFRAAPGVEERVRTLAAMEERCCAFLRMTVTVEGDEVRWEARGPETARAFLDEFVRLPETVWGSPDDLRARVSAAGLRFEDLRGERLA